MPNLKVVFHVEDEQKATVVEKSQMWIEIDPNKELTIEGVHLDQMAEFIRLKLQLWMQSNIPA